jgi:hypothetical protein
MALRTATDDGPNRHYWRYTGRAVIRAESVDPGVLMGTIALREYRRTS